MFMFNQMYMSRVYTDENTYLIFILSVLTYKINNPQYVI